jgi:tetratricopeptide (TPR) repeat protein
MTAAVTDNAGEAARHYALGRAHKAANDLSAAEQSYRQALHLHPEYLDAWVSLGIVLRIGGRLGEAEACQRAALKLDPASFLALLNLGTVLSAQSRFAEAAEFFGRAIKINPRSANAHCNLGIALLQLNDGRAARHFSEALTLDPEHFEAALNLGKSCLETGQFERAIEALAHARGLRPGSLESQFLLATSYFRAGRFDTARGEFERLMREHPAWPLPPAGLACVLVELGQYSEPLALFERALELGPDDVQVRAYYGLLLLRRGEFGRGWDFYDSRSAALLRTHAIERKFPAPRWQGEPLEGKTLLVTREQGFGDELMFASVLPEILNDAAHGIVECDRRLATLFRRSFPNATVVSVDGGESGENRALERNLDRLPKLDYWTPSGSLPRYRRRSAEDFPQHQGYLQADTERTRHWKTRLDSLGAGIKVGLSWRGGTAITRANVRSLTLEQLAPVLATPAAHFVSVQYGKCRDEMDSFSRVRSVPIHHWDEAIEDYDETAALVSALDLVVSVCTAVVNLGGALNRPVWVMAPLVADARYGRQGATTVWYPSVRVFRQSQLDMWQPVIAEVRDALTRLVQDQSTLEARA